MSLPFPILGVLLNLVFAEPGAGEVAALVRGADALLRDGHPRKALVLLRRARGLDSSQSEVDRLVDRCRARLGMWVAPDAEADWNVGESRLAQACRERPDSMAEVAHRRLEAEDIGLAVEILRRLAEDHATQPARVSAYKDALARQELKVAFHLDLARLAASRGLVSDAVRQWRFAWSARPGDPLLREKVESAEASLRTMAAMSESDLRARLGRGDLEGAIAVVRRIRVAIPEDERLRSLQDSLLERRRAALLRRIGEIGALLDAGRERAAMDALEALGEIDPQDPLVGAAQESLQRRIQERRRAAKLDSLAKAVAEAIQAGDAGRATAIYLDLRRIGLGDSAETRLRPRIDSLRNAERASGMFHEAMASARRSLARRDVAGGKAGLQKALSARPENPVAKKLLADLGTARPPEPDARPEGERPVVVETGTARKVRSLLLAGVVAYRAGEYEKAMSQWRLALELDPDCVQAQRYIANVGKKQARLR